MSQLAPASARVLELLQARCQHLLDTNAAGGIGYTLRDESQMRITRLEASGVTIDPQDEEDTIPSKGARCTVEVEMEVTEGLVNLGLNLHGGVVAYLIDMASSLPLICLSGHGRWPSSGVSTQLNIYYLAAAPLGTPIRIISSVLTQGLVVAVMECQVVHAETGKVLMVGTHVKQDGQPPKPFFSAKL